MQDRTTIVPTKLPFLAINPSEFLTHVSSNEHTGESETARVTLDSNASVVHAPGVKLILPVKKESNFEPKLQNAIVLEEIFMPFFDNVPSTPESAWWEVLDLLTENVVAPHINILVLTQDTNHPRWKTIVKILEDQSRLQVIKGIPII